MMSLETVQGAGAASGGNAPRASGLSSYPRTSVSDHPDHSNSRSLPLGHVDEVALAATYQESITNPSTIPPQKQESQQPGVDSPIVEESAGARLERLGRQRPEVFKSTWAEIGFVFSISMSQVLSVSSKSSITLLPYS